MLDTERLISWMEDTCPWHKKNTARLESMIEKIIDIAKIENNRLVPNMVAVEINQEVKDIVEECIVS